MEPYVGESWCFDMTLIAAARAIDKITPATVVMLLLDGIFTSVALSLTMFASRLHDVLRVSSEMCCAVLIEGHWRAMCISQQVS